jgi:hypothetical protein
MKKSPYGCAGMPRALFAQRYAKPALRAKYTLGRGYYRRLKKGAARNDPVRAARTIFSPARPSVDSTPFNVALAQHHGRKSNPHHPGKDSDESDCVGCWRMV